MGIKSSQSTFRVLWLLAKRQDPISPAEVASDLDLPMTTALRVLATLEAGGYAEREQGSSGFTLGNAAHTLALAFMSQFPVCDIALPYLQRLTLESGQSSSLFIRLGWYAVRATTILNEGMSAEHLRVGAQFPIPKGGPAIVISAYLSEDERRLALAHSKADMDKALEARIESVRKDGFLLLATDETRSSFDYVVPLFASSGRIIGAVALESMPGTFADLTDKSDVVWSIISEMVEALKSLDEDQLSHYGHVDPQQIEF